MIFHSYMKKTSKLVLIFTLILTLLNSPLMAAPYASEKPKLVLLIVIDQFRSDYLTRFKKLFKPAYGTNGEVGGFEYLTTEGAYYPFAEYDILQSMTGPGHATILTGAYPYQSGVPVNEWYNANLKKKIESVEDATTKSVPESTLAGMSPRNLLATTVGDELKNAGYPSRVFSIALKDRASIMMGGHRADLSIWFEPKSFQWISSQYYLPEGKLPEWLNKLNASITAQKGKSITWDKKGAGSGLSLENPMIVADVAKDSGGEFPHVQPIGSKGSLNMPFGLDLTENAAEKIIEEFKLGNGKATDVLAVSFSSHDYMGHGFGPNSREMEEFAVADDASISKLLNFVKKRVPGGLSNVVVVLTADHGIPPNPDWLKKEKVDAGRLDSKALISTVEKRLENKFGKLGNEPWIVSEFAFNFYLNKPAIGKKKLDLALVESEAKAALLEIHGVAHVVTSTDYQKRILPPGQHARQVLKTYYPGRSGDLIIIPLPHYMSNYATVTHQTGYNYDRMVPVILSGFKIKRGVHSEKAEVVDIAPTLSFLTGTIAPSMSEGRVLSEALLP
jgi:predicted AlkP superfamily pyrophosphatase or phosphodiesterase